MKDIIDSHNCSGSILLEEEAHEEAQEEAPKDEAEIQVDNDDSFDKGDLLWVSSFPNLFWIGGLI
ncbi:hypothetical protein AMTR_s00092p00156500 [Amborella trichopoda]|uniref:Uncharacterized protein n=1 Tax=Amborella trichopoda TaxID=13333 RepID=W1NVJ5_AMBTC|nr:hypothetical protein AMTR_s00092p00156500 [Amborella trichopoda]